MECTARTEAGECGKPATEIVLSRPSDEMIAGPKGWDAHPCCGTEHSAETLRRAIQRRDPNAQVAVLRSGAPFRAASYTAALA